MRAVVPPSPSSRTLPLLLAAGLAAAVAGCATADSRAAAYERALAPWQGATEEALVARWGPPRSREAADHGQWLTYVVQSTAGTAATASFGIGGFAFGGGGRGRYGGGIGVGAAVPVGAPSTLACITHFLVEDGRVAGWNFEGEGCGTMG